MTFIEKVINKLRYIYFSFKPFPQLIKQSLDGTKSICHISAFSYGNAGDAILPVVLRDLFNRCCSVKAWSSIHVYKRVDTKSLEKINSNDAMVIGGGGLFLKDTNKNDISGWQWPCSVEAINSIKVPIIMFAVGYNRFRGQDEFEPYFTDNINAFVAKASFVGLRNHGSINKVRGYLRSEELKEKVVFQPCMTTMIAKIYPDLVDYSAKEDFIAINCAFDRSEQRSHSDVTMWEIAQVALELSKVTHIKYFAHMQADCKILRYFEAIGLDYELVKFVDMKHMVEQYSKARLVIGMRGHAQMVPFGCLTPIISIISHDKMQWFLDDINNPDWGVELLDPDFKKLLLSRSLDAYDNYQQRYETIKSEQERLWQITMENMNKINKIL